MLLKKRLNTALILLTLIGGVACADDDASSDGSSDDDSSDDAGEGASGDDASDDDSGDDDASDDDSGDDDASDDDAGDDDSGDDDSGDDDSGDDDSSDDDAADDDAADDDSADDEDVDDSADDDSADDDSADDDSADDGSSDDDSADDDSADDDSSDDDSSDDESSDDDSGDNDSGDDDVSIGDDAGMPANGGACTLETDCNEGSTCYDGICVQSGTGLRVSLSWTALADLDIHVFAPNGDEIWWNEPVGGGGVLDVDDCLFDEEFYCADADGTHVESVFFEAPEAGDYLIVVYGYETGGELVDFIIRVFSDDVEVESVQGMVGTDETAETTLTYAP